MTTPDGQLQPFRDTVLTLAGLGVILALLRTSASIVEPILLSVLIVAIASPFLKAMRRVGISTGVSVAVGLFVIIALLSGFSILFSGALTEFSDALPEFQAQIINHTARVDAWFASKGLELHKGGVLHHFGPDRLLKLIESVIAHLGSALGDALLILFIVIFMLAEATHFPRKLTAVLGAGGVTSHAIARLLEDVKRYASTKALVSAVTGLLIWVGLKAFGLEHAELWGALAFMLNFIPNIGSILAAAPAVMVAVLHGSPLYVCGVVGLYLGVNVGIGNVLEPILVGRRTGLSSVTVLLSLVFWGWMFGIAGILAAVPLSMAVRAFAQTYPPIRWISILMGPNLEEDPPDEIA